jgi:hypothetical protein
MAAEAATAARIFAWLLRNSRRPAGSRPGSTHSRVTLTRSTEEGPDISHKFGGFTTLGARPRVKRVPHLRDAERMPRLHRRPSLDISHLLSFDHVIIKP